MTSKTISFGVLCFSLLLSMMRTTPLYAAGPADGQMQQTKSATGFAQRPAADVKGTWSGTLFSKHNNVAPFTITVVINPDSRGHLVGSSSFDSDCLKGAQLEVTVTGTNVVLAGSDEEGDNITVRGTVDGTGTQLKSTYILNGSTTGRCETDDGAGTLAKR